MESLCQQQSVLGKAIEKLRTNFKKDGPSRKTMPYLEAKLQRLDFTWQIFEANDIRLQEFKQQHGDESYFAKNYHQAVEQIYEDLREAITTTSDQLQQTTSSQTKQFEELQEDKDKTDIPDEIQRQIKKQKATMAALERLLATIEKEIVSSKSNAYYKQNIQTLEDYWKKISDTHMDIMASDISETHYEENLFSQTELRYRDIVIALKEKVIHTTLEQPKSSQIKLPKINIPIFDGNYIQWRQFHDIYEQLIQNNHTISRSEKMFYLKANLTGEAAKLVQHLQVSEDNYDTAWQLLNNRYNNKRIIIFALLNKLLTQPGCNQESVAGLKKIHDTTNESILAIENLGVPTGEWDPIIVYMLLQKLDRESHRLFEQTLDNHKEVPKLSQLLEFLETRFQMLESIGRKDRLENKPVSSDPNKKYTHTITKVTPSCAVCRKDHQIYNCGIFLKLSPTQRRDQIKDLRLCFNCLKEGHVSTSCSSSCCRKCNQRHNTLLHIQPAPASKPISTSKSTASRSATNLSASEPQRRDTNYVFLATAIVDTVGNNQNRILTRALLDSGSQLNFISEELCKRLRVAVNIEHLELSGVGSQKSKIQRKVNLSIRSRTNGYSAQIEAFVLPNITSQQPNQFIDVSSWPIPNNIQLADHEFNKPRRIDLLLGAELYSELMTIGQIKMADHLPTLQNTTLGWIILGAANGIQRRSPFCGVGVNFEKNLDKQLERFWTIEEAQSEKRPFTQREQKGEDIFKSTTIRGQSGKFIVKLPFLHNPTNLGKSEEIATRRFISLEKRLEKNANLKAEYNKFIHEYLALDHMELVHRKELSNLHYFLPHHCVLNPSSTTTKLRVVFDASAKTLSNISLNEVLHVGPAIQDDLFNILIRFRLHRYVITADIEKMYRQILIAEEDQQFQLILWRDSPLEQIQIYKLKTVTYGTAPASYLSTKCIQMLASENQHIEPVSCKAISNDFYVDDLMTGANSLQDAIMLRKKISSVLSSGGFHLRKWCSNHPAIIKGIPKADLQSQLDIDDAADGSVKTLGISWLPSTDNFIFKTTWPDVKRVTKRTILADTAHLFDPLGFVNPVVVRAKILLQHLWRLKLDWDAALPIEMHTQWLKLRQDLAGLAAVKIPRFALSNSYNKIQIHAFSDASEKAYGTAIYLRTIDENNLVGVHLLCAKSRVAPLKTTSLARLELCAAQIMALLVDRVKRCMDIPVYDIFYWTDSQIVISWLRSESSFYNTFVANRVSSIQQISNISNWNYVSTNYNPADLVSRGASPKKLINSNLWFSGPEFLKLAEEFWILNKEISSDPDLERKTTKFTFTTIKDKSHFIHNIDHRNSVRWLQRVISYIIRFNNKLQKLHINMVDESDNNVLSVQELEAALMIIIRFLQSEYFYDELLQIKKKKHVSLNSQLSSLNPFLDQKGIIRVGGRLTFSQLSYDAKYPILLPSEDVITRLLISQVHKDNLHAGPQALLAIIRQRFWPVKGRRLASTAVRRCVICSKMKPKLLSQLMGNLPATRVQPARAFFNSGVDFCGPIWTHFKLRGKRPQKSYIAVFCCFVTKAIHLELVSDLTTSGFLGALRRFISRRGKCQNLYCDNATNFVGARNKLEEIALIFKNNKTREEIVYFCTTKGMQFHFIPPRAPHFGGLWEAAVKSAKFLLQRTMASASLTYEELSTLIAEVEAVLNSRPLTPMSSSPADLAALTPGHFLIGEPMTAVPDLVEEETNINLLTRWKRVAYIKQEFWRRWTKEYLCELQQRHKWKTINQNVSPGMMVIIQDENLPPLKWQLGRIENVIPGDDNLVRVVDVRTTSGIIRRPIARLAPLPVVNSENISKVDCLQPQAENNVTNHSHTDSHARLTDKIEVGIDVNKKQKKKHLPKTRNVNKKTSLLNLVLLVLFVAPAWCSKLQEPVEVSRITDHPGIYFERLGQTSMVTDDWNLIVYYDLQGYFDEFRGLQQIVSKLQGFCNLTVSFPGICEDTLSQLEHQLDIIKAGNQILVDHSDSIGRQKRGLFNIVGNIAHTLFGVLDENYAEEMSKTIRRINNNEARLIDLIKNQTSILEVTENVIKRNQAQVKAQFDLMNDQISALVPQLNKLKSEIFVQRIMHTFMSLALRATLIATSHIRMQDSLCDLVTDLHHGKINPILLSPNQLQMALRNISVNIPSSLTIPEVQGQLKMVTMYKLMSAQVKLTGSLLLFKIRIPLTRIEYFELFKLIPLPTFHNGSFVYIQPSADLLVVNLHRDYYYEMSDQEFNQCTSIAQHHICKQTRPLFNRQTNKCEISLLNHEADIPSSCKLRVVPPSTFWFQLHNRNEWLFSLDREYIINIVCNNVVHQKTISAEGILKFHEKCMLKQGHVIINSYKVYRSELSASFVPSFNISDRLFKYFASNLTNLRIIHHNYTEESLVSLDSALRNMKQNERFPEDKSTDSAHLFTIAYVAFVSAVFIATYQIINYLRKRCWTKKDLISKAPVATQQSLRDARDNCDTEFELPSI